MASALPTDYNGLLRLLKREQAEMKRIQAQYKKVQDENKALKSQATSTHSPLPSPVLVPPDPHLLTPVSSSSSTSSTHPPSSSSQHNEELKTISETLKALMANYSTMAADMEALNSKWISTVRTLNQYEASMGASDDIPPPTGTVTWVFTDVQDSTPLWEISPQNMQKALNIHNKIMRKKILEHRAYEIRTQGDSFVLAFQNPIDAANFCVDVQERLMEVEWDETLLHMHKSTSQIKDDSGRPIFNGLRVRMGIHTGVPDFCEKDATSKRMDYFGPAMNLAARVGGAGNGGQIVFSSQAGKEIQATPNVVQRVQIKDLGEFSLKGVEQRQRLFEMLPLSLANRSFPQIASVGTETEKLVADLKKMKDESEAVLREMEKMKGALASAQERCSAVHNLIQQIRRDKLDLDNPVTLLEEIDQLIRDQAEMRQMVDTTRQQTLDLQTNLSGIDDRVEGFREQHQRVVDVTIAQMHVLLKKVVETLEQKGNQMLAEEEIVDQRFELSVIVSDLTSLKMRIEQQIQAGDNCEALSPFNIEMAPSRVFANTLDLINLRYSAAAHLKYLKSLAAKHNEEHSLFSPKGIGANHLPPKHILKPIAAAPKPKEQDDPLQRMKNSLQRLEQELGLPEAFKYLEGTSFQFMGKKLVLSWSGEKLGVRLGGGFQPIDAMVKQLMTRKQFRPVLPAVGTPPHRSTSPPPAPIPPIETHLGQPLKLRAMTN